MVENVESFEAELQAESFRNRDILKRGEIETDEIRSAQNAAAVISPDGRRVCGVRHRGDIPTLKRIMGPRLGSWLLSRVPGSSRPPRLGLADFVTVRLRAATASCLHLSLPAALCSSECQRWLPFLSRDQ